MSENQIAEIVIEEIDILSDYTSSEIKGMYNPPSEDPKLSRSPKCSLKSCANVSDFAFFF